MKNTRYTKNINILGIIILCAVMLYGGYNFIYNSISFFRGQVDDIEYDFVTDETVVGTWVSIDFVKCIEDFDPNIIESESEYPLKLMRFAKEGKMNINGDEEQSWLSWTKGLVINKKRKFASMYQIVVIDDIEYMFYEWKTGEYKYLNGKPSYYVLIREQ